jgi:hypothetical protein
MDPATIGLLISIAPTVLDLLFGRGSDFQSRSKNNIIKQETLLENPDKKCTATVWKVMVIVILPYLNNM